MSESASAAPRPSEQPTSSDLTVGQASHRSASPAITRRCAASSPGSVASQARPVSASASPELFLSARAAAGPGPSSAAIPHHLSDRVNRYYRRMDKGLAPR